MLLLTFDGGSASAFPPLSENNYRCNALWWRWRCVGTDACEFHSYFYGFLTALLHGIYTHTHSYTHIYIHTYVNRYVREQQRESSLIYLFIYLCVRFKYFACDAHRWRLAQNSSVAQPLFNCRTKTFHPFFQHFIYLFSSYFLRCVCHFLLV